MESFCKSFLTLASSLLSAIQTQLIAMIYFLLNYFEENSAAFICAYIAIIVDALWKKYARERKAKRSYLSLLGILIEHNTIPDKEGLASLKKHFSKNFNTQSSSFPLYKKALEELYLLYEADSSISLERKAILQDKITKFQNEFSSQDSLVEATPYYVSYRDTLRNDLLIDFGMMLVLLTLSSPPKTFETAMINTLLAVIATIFGVVLYWIASFVRHKAKIVFKKRSDNQQQSVISTTKSTTPQTQEATRQKT